MTSRSETGHARNVAAFEQLISFCQAYGSRYHPTRAALELNNLISILGDARAALQQTKVTEAAFGNATHHRVDQYKLLRPMATRIINALTASEATPGAVPAARSIVNKIQGSGKKKTETPPAPTGEEGNTETHKTISRSQASYDNLVDHMDKQVELLATEPNYQPYEPELQLTSLRSYAGDMHQANTDVINTYTVLSNARMQRDAVLYNPLSGMVSVALDVKKYIKSVFGASSAEYKQVSGLEIKMRKKD